MRGWAISETKKTQFLTQQEVCQLLRISPKKLQQMRRMKQIKYLQYGYRSIRFRHEDVIAYIRRHEMKAA
jgi:excisionase family DNA binding protein